LHSAVDLDFCFTKVKFSSLFLFFKEKSRKFHFQVFAVGDQTALPPWITLSKTTTMAITNKI